MNRLRYPVQRYSHALGLSGDQWVVLFLLSALPGVSHLGVGAVTFVLSFGLARLANHLFGTPE